MTNNQKDKTMKNEEVEAIDAEIISDYFKAPVLQDIKYPVSENSLLALVAKYKDVQEINLDTSDEEVAEQYKVVRDGHIELSKERNKIEKTRKAIKDPAFTFGKNVDAFAKKLQLIIVSTETMLKTQRDKVENNEARKQREVEEAEELRVDNIKKAISDIRAMAGVHYNSSSIELTKALESLSVPNEEMYEEFLEEAREVQQVTIMQLQEMRKSKVAAERVHEIEAEKELEAKLLKDEQDKKFQVEKDAFAKKQNEFEEQQRLQQENIRLQQEAIDIQNAEREADELLVKQEKELKERKQKSIQLKAQYEHESFLDLDNLLNSDGVDIVTLVDMIVDNKVRHLKWEI